MARYAVLLHLVGPFHDSEYDETFGGAYTTRFVDAGSDEEARYLARRGLLEEARVKKFRPNGDSSALAVEIESVRAAGWHEGRFSIGEIGFTFYSPEGDSDQPLRARALTRPDERRS